MASLFWLMGFNKLTLKERCVLNKDLETCERANAAAEIDDNLFDKDV